MKGTHTVAKRTDGTKSRSVRGIEFYRANFAGTMRSGSVPSFSGLSAGRCGFGPVLKDRNVIGVYPLKTELLNIARKPQEDFREQSWGSKGILGLEMAAITRPKTCKLGYSES
jgi:hypothetical protein